MVIPRVTRTYRALSWTRPADAARSAIVDLANALKPWLIVVLIVPILVACARPDHPAPGITGDLATRVRLADVPFHPQAERDDCGPAALAMMLGSTGLERTPKELAAKVYTPGRTGTLQADIVQAVRREGRLGLAVDNLEDLLAELNAGNPVLVLQNLGLERWPIWHYAVAMGYDLDQQDLYLHSGTDAALSLSFSAFEKSWQSSDRWALTITRPGHLPTSAASRDILTAASALEEAGKSREAAYAYGALLERTPNNLPALMGWGNARYADGDYRTASEAFRQAVTLHPEATEAWNNLAASLAEQDRLDEALSAAEEAVRQGGPYRAAAEATLREIKQKRLAQQGRRQPERSTLGTTLS